MPTHRIVIADPDTHDLLADLHGDVSVDSLAVVHQHTGNRIGNAPRLVIDHADGHCVAELTEGSPLLGGQPHDLEVNLSVFTPQDYDGYLKGGGPRLAIRVHDAANTTPAAEVLADLLADPDTYYAR